MSWDPARLPDQSGRTAVVTGANSGLGLEIAARLAAAGADVTLACRNQEKAAAAADRIRDRSPGATLSLGRLDLADLASVSAFASDFRERHARLDLLVNNAGLMGVDPSRTVDGFETTFGVNHLGPFALTQHLMPLLLSTSGSRIGTMASMGHRPGRMHFDDLMLDRGYHRWPAYFQSKLANILFTRGLQRRLTVAGATTRALAAHPGASRTDLGYEGTGPMNRLLPFLMPIGTQPVRIGALPMLRAMTDPDAEPGAFYGPRLVIAGPAVREKPSRRARSDADAEELWRRSVALTGIDAFA